MRPPRRQLPCPTGRRRSTTSIHDRRHPRIPALWSALLFLETRFSHPCSLPSRDQVCSSSLWRATIADGLCSSGGLKTGSLDRCAPQFHTARKACRQNRGRAGKIMRKRMCDKARGKMAVLRGRQSCFVPAPRSGSARFRRRQALCGHDACGFASQDGSSFWRLSAAQHLARQNPDCQQP